MDYTRDQIEEYGEVSFEFVHWLDREGFITVSDVNCTFCGSTMRLRCTPPSNRAQIAALLRGSSHNSHPIVRSNYHDLGVLQCPNSLCKRTRSIRSGSFFHHSHYDVYKQMLIICCFCEDMRVSVCARDLGVSRNRASDYYDNLRGCYLDQLEEHPIQFTSHGPYEIDEFLIRHVETTPGYFSNVWVQDILDRESGLYWAKIIPDRSADTLTPNILDLIPSGAIVFSDDWTGYHTLKSRGYRHFRVTHSHGEYSRETTIEGQKMEVHINTVEGLHRGLRQRLMNKSRRNLEKMELHIGEYIYRHSGRSLFDPFKIHRIH